MRLLFNDFEMTQLIVHLNCLLVGDRGDAPCLSVPSSIAWVPPCYYNSVTTEGNVS